VTVRSWISKGRLRAKRAGQRKWVVRRSELDRMLGDNDQAAALPFPAAPPPEPAIAGPNEEMPVELQLRLTEDQAERYQQLAEADLSAAEYDWWIALERSRMAPPDARFMSRMRQIADAARSRAVNLGANQNEDWFALQPDPAARGMTLSYELRPGGNRPGPKDGWNRIDRVVERVGGTSADGSVSRLITALQDLARALADQADAIEQNAPYRTGDWHPFHTANEPDATE
jgi:hypothetical protein